MKYSELTRHHFETALHAGVLSGPGVRRGAAGSIERGTWVQFDLKIGRGADAVDEARFLAYGCPHVIAVADWLAGAARGRILNLALPENVHALRQRFAVPVQKLGRLLVLEDAWKAAAASPYPT